MDHPLRERSCEPCRGGVPALDREEIAALLAWTPQWTVLAEPMRIERAWRLGSFAEALAFVQEVARIAERQGHHPDICFGWGYVRLSLHTHAIGGLHVNDFVLASKIDAWQSENPVDPSED